jgi:hypothetical protein
LSVTHLGVPCGLFINDDEEVFVCHDSPRVK